jgi:hypothetical protein
MGLFSKKEKPRDDGALTLAQTWTILGDQLGLSVEVYEADAIRATGTVNGRAIEVEISADGGGAMTGALSDFVEGASGRRRRGGGKRRPWHTSLVVACVNPRGLAGTLVSVVDLDDPSWDPRNFDPAHCRVVRTDPSELAPTLVTPAVQERMMSVAGDVMIAIGGQRVTLAAEADVKLDAGFIAGSIIHQLPRSILTWPERGTAGPPWWIDTLCVVADAVDAA